MFEPYKDFSLLILIDIFKQFKHVIIILLWLKIFDRV